MCRAVKGKLVWNGVLRLFIQSYQSVCFCVMVSLFYLEQWGSRAWVVSNLACIALFVSSSEGRWCC